MIYDCNEIKLKLQTNLTAKRYEHTIGVAYTAYSMALRYGENPEKALVAGLLHDCAKCIEDSEALELCKLYNVKLTKVEYDNPLLIHAKLGAAIAEAVYGIEDRYILDAIRYHTTGRANMTLLERIIFISDYIEPCRKEIAGLATVRDTVYKDMNMAIVLICQGTLRHLKNTGQPIDEATLSTYNYYNEVIGNGNE